MLDIEFPKKCSGIYGIINTVTCKQYIGSAVDIKIRWRLHRNELNRNDHKNSYLQNAWNKYGEENFVFTVVEYCEKEKLADMEQYWIDFLKVCQRQFGYNLAPKARTQLGFRHSDDTKIRMSLSKQIMSAETKAKMSAAQLGKKQTLEHIANMINAKRGFKHSEETKLRMSLSNKLRNLDKWPHKWGQKCKCDECRNKKIAICKEYKKKLKKEAINVSFS